MAKEFNGNTTEKEKRGSTEDTNTTETTKAGGTTGTAGGTEGISDIENVQGTVVEKPKRKRPVRKKAPAKKKKETGLETKDLNPLLQGIFGLVSLKYGEHWNISEEEAEHITKPLANILEKLNINDKISNLSDGAGLVIGATAIVIPRVMMTDFKQKPKKAIENHVKEFSKNEFEQAKSREVKKDSGNTNEEVGTSKNDGGIDKALLEPVPEFA